MYKTPLSVITGDGFLTMELLMEGNVVFYNSRKPSDKQPPEFLCVNIRLPHPWYPMKVHFLI